jgi:hypothetical protein
MTPAQTKAVKMDEHLAKKLLEHLGHDIEIATYGDRNDPRDVTVECLDCCAVVVSCDEG